MDLTKVTRITVIQYPEGRVFERKNLYDNGVELDVQDDGRTLKIFPRKEGKCTNQQTKKQTRQTLHSTNTRSDPTNQ
ncbi:Hypothetical protein ROUS_39 [Brevibacterium phage Rousseau]|nr:Hypothetical protein ROUS_39 [Brevibacterium phage Rousseau]